MFGLYVTAALRNLKKNFGYTAINLFGLALGLSVALLIFVFVRHELSYDSYHDSSDNLYRIVLDGQFNGAELNAPLAPAPMGRTIVNDYPEAEASARVFGFGGERILRRGEAAFTETAIMVADSTIFELLSFEFLRGDPTTSLTTPRSIVLTQSLAQKIFGDEDAYGESIIIGDTTRMEIVGVIADPPTNSHLQFSALQTMLDMPNSQDDAWISNSFVTYLRLRAGTDPRSLIAKLPTMFETYAGPQISAGLGMSYEDFLAGGNVLAYTLQPIEDVHLKSNFAIDIQSPGSLSYVILFSAIAVFILLLACINYMNLATARSATRAREVGVRKAVGSNRAQLILQFLSESAVLTVLSLTLALGFVWLAMPSFNQITGRSLELASLLSPGFLAAMLGGAVLVSLISGMYPAFYLSSFNPAIVLKSETFSSGSKSLLRTVLVVFQFSISITLLIGTFVVQDQLEFIQDKEIGFDRDHIIVLSRASDLQDQSEAFKSELLTHPNILAVGGSSSLPGQIHGGSGFIPEGHPSDELIIFSPIFVDNDFVEAMGITMAAGRDFSPDFPSDSNAVMINRAALAIIGWDDAMGRTLGDLQVGEDEAIEYRPIVGVIEDYHFLSFRSEIGGAVYRLATFTPNNLIIRVTGENVESTMAHISETWSDFRPGTPLNVSFLNESFSELFDSDERLAQLFTGFSIFAIIIASLGLFGLGFFVTEQRTKEIGIRKALGATISEIVILLSKDFTRLVLISIFVAVPLGYYGMSRWLGDFVYHTNLGFSSFLMAGGLAIVIAWVTVSYQSIKAARANPIESLRHG